MSKTLRTVATIAAAAALIATGVGAVAGTAVAVAGVKVGTIAAIASTTAAAASVGAQLTAPKPIARGSPAQVVIDIEPPRPYIVGQVMTGGVMRHDVAYGATLKKVPNPFRWQVRVLSGVGPIQGIVGEYFDFTPVDNGYFGGFFNSVQNLGTRPQTTALVPPYGAAPGWTTSSRLSGCAHVGLNFKFDRDGKVFASGLPIYTALCDGEKVYDPRQDSTYPGGSGACRAGVESTYVYNRNPACHAVTYALGRFQNGVRVFGLGQPVDTLDMAAIVDWANDCDANEWTVNMILTEGGTGANLREQRVRNLDDLCAAGGARWYQAGGLLSFDWHRPRLALATLTDDDILEAGGGTDAVQTVRDRMNGVRPQYVSPDHNWQQITAAEIVGSTYRTEDGGEKLVQVYPLNGVTNAAQAGELAAYAMTDSREIGPMDLQAKAKWRFYRPGDCIEIDSSLVAYDGLAVINQRSLNPQSLAVALSLKSETPGKHDFALGKVASPPPTPTLLQTTEERDLLAAAAITPRAVDVEFDDNSDLESLKPGEAGSTRNVPRGTYAAGTTYVRGDSVLFSGSSYQLIVASSTGNAPPDVARWALLANAGSGPAGADGLPGLTVIVSNEAHVVATAADGSGGDYTGAGGQMRVLRGETVLTPTFSIAAKTPNTSWISIDSSGNYTVTDPGVDLATATLRAVNVGINYDRTYTLARSKQGVTGPRLALAADNQAFTFTDGAANPGSQTITIDALLNNLSGTATWSTTPAVTLGGSGNTRTLTVANFGSNRQVTVEATLGGITDRITIVRTDRATGALAAENSINAGGPLFVGTLPVAKADSGLINANVPLGSNAVVNSDFTRGKFGWRWRGGSNEVDWGVNLPGTPNWFGQRNVMWANVPGTLAVGDVADLYPNTLWNGGSIANAPLFAMPVVQGDRLAATVLAAPHRCTFQLYMLFFDGAGAWIAYAPSASGGTSGGAQNGDPANFGLLTVVDTAPANARWAIPMMRMLGTGETSPFIFFTEPMLSKIASGQTTAPRYTPGRADPNADVTSANTAAFIAGQGTLATKSSVDLATAEVLNKSLANVDSTANTKLGGIAAGATVGARAGTNVFRSDGSTVLSQAEIRTAEGTAAAIANQGTLATANSAAWGSQITGRPVFTTDVVNVDGADRLNSWYVRNPNDGSLLTNRWAAELGANVTESRTAAAISGQSPWATTSISTGRVSRLQDDGFIQDNTIYRPGVAALSERWPAEANANVTETRVAASISGQGDLATRNSATLPFGFGNLAVNSDFVNGLLGWSAAWDGNQGGTVNRGINLSGFSGQINVLFAWRPGSLTAGTVFDAFITDAPGGMDGYRRFAIPVLPGDRLCFSWLLGTHRCSGYAILGFYDGSGNYIEEHGGSTIAENFGALGGNPSTMGRSVGFATAPANARYAKLWARATVSGAADPYMFCAQPFVTKVPISQTAVPAYSSGSTDRAADVTAEAQRSIEPQFPSIEIKQGEAGHTGNRTVTHTAKRSTATLTGGTWSLPLTNLGAGSATINSGTGTVTLSGIVQSGAYAVRYTHTDGLATDLAVNVTYIPTPPGGVVSAKTGRATSFTGTDNNNNWQTIVSLTINSAPAGRVNFGGGIGLSFLNPDSGTDTADFEARMLMDGATTLTSVTSQNVVTGGILAFADFTLLFAGSHAVSAGNRTFEMQLRRTSGTGRILSTVSALEATIIAT